MTWRSSIWLLFAFCLLISTAAAQSSLRIPQGNAGIREYFPGDIVHIIIEAPLDTATVRAAMPDGETVSLNYDGRTNMWHGYWEVPAGFKKGLYQAALTASDLEGNIFSGVSGNFYISEPALALMFRMPSKEEGITASGISSKEAAAKQRAVDSALLAREEERKKAIREQVVEEYFPPTSGVPEVRQQTEIRAEVPRPKKTTKAAAKPYRPAKTKYAKAAKEDISSTKVKLIVSAKNYLNQLEYEKAHAEIKRLLNLEPDNQGIRQIYNRLAAVIKARNAQ